MSATGEGEGITVEQLFAALRQRDDALSPPLKPRSFQEMREAASRRTEAERAADAQLCRLVTLQLRVTRFIAAGWTPRRYRPRRARPDTSG